MNYRHYGLWNIQDIIFIIIIMYQSVKKKSVFEKYFSNTPKYANQIQIQIQIFHLVGFQIQIQIQIQIFAYLNTNTNTNTYLTPALTDWSEFCHLWGVDKLIFWSHYVLKQLIGRLLLCGICHVMVICLRNTYCWKVSTTFWNLMWALVL